MTLMVLFPVTEEVFLDCPEKVIIAFHRNKSSHQRCTIKKSVLRNLQNSQENTCARVSLLINRLYQERDSVTGVFL